MTDAVISRLVESAPLAGPIIGGLFAWWMAFHLPLPRWWTTR